MDLKSLLAPKSVALIGASNKEGSLGHDMVRMINNGGFKGEVYPINPRYESVCGLKCYPSLESIGKPVDVAALCVAAKRVEGQVQNAIDSGVKSLVVFANCVVENDTTPSLEDKLIKMCNDANIPLLGHNAMGYYNNDIDLRVCGFEAPDEGVKGNISLISQSGSVFSTLGHNDPQLKFNLMVATGTGQVTSLSDYMIYAIEQETTKVLGVYMESIRKPERFIEALELAKEKRIPIVAMKVGKSELGAEFAKSHSGGLAGDDDAIQAVFDHYGVVRAESFDEMANTLLLFSHYEEIPKGGLVAIADSGGERNLLADDAEVVGIEYAKLSDKTMEELQEIQEFGQEASNPLDPWGTGIDFDKIFGDSLVTMMKDDNAAIGIISQDLRDDYFLSEGCIEALSHTRENTSKPLAFLTNYSGSRRGMYTQRLNEIGVPVLVGTQPALKAIKSFLEFRDFQYGNSQVKELDLSEESKKLLEENEVLQESDSMKVLDELGFPVAKAHLINSVDELKEKKELFEYPVVLKTAAEGILHKADVGGVVLNIENYESLEKYYVDMSSRLGNPSVVAPMVSFDVEIILGMKTDATFGPLVVVGAGGIYTELLNDKIVLLPNTSREEIVSKLKTLKTYKLFTGYRGTKEVNMGRLVDTIKNFCEIVSYLSSWAKEIDINPVALSGDKITALDALIICK
ncbi:acetate--CoA ligase family protein [Anaeromicrobium sediminis]|nr:acetate--CoA ligase family protein [Anaeromicrobium sediminis]